MTNKTPNILIFCIIISVEDFVKDNIQTAIFWVNFYIKLHPL